MMYSCCKCNAEFSNLQHLTQHIIENCVSKTTSSLLRPKIAEKEASSKAYSTLLFRKDVMSTIQESNETVMLQPFAIFENTWEQSPLTVFSGEVTTIEGKTSTDNTDINLKNDRVESPKSKLEAIDNVLGITNNNPKILNTTKKNEAKTAAESTGFINLEESYNIEAVHENLNVHNIRTYIKDIKEKHLNAINLKNSIEEFHSNKTAQNELKNQNDKRLDTDTNLKTNSVIKDAVGTGNDNNQDNDKSGVTVMDNITVPETSENLKACNICNKLFSFNFELKRHKAKYCKLFLAYKKRHKLTLSQKNISGKGSHKFIKASALKVHRRLAYRDFQKPEKRFNDVKRKTQKEKKIVRKDTNKSSLTESPVNATLSSPPENIKTENHEIKTISEMKQNNFSENIVDIKDESKFKPNRSEKLVVSDNNSAKLSNHKHYLNRLICDICHSPFDNENALTRHKKYYCKRFDYTDKPDNSNTSKAGRKLQTAKELPALSKPYGLQKSATVSNVQIITSDSTQNSRHCHRIIHYKSGVVIYKYKYGEKAGSGSKLLSSTSLDTTKIEVHENLNLNTKSATNKKTPDAIIESNTPPMDNSKSCVYPIKKNSRTSEKNRKTDCDRFQHETDFIARDKLFSKEAERENIKDDLKAKTHIQTFVCLYCKSNFKTKLELADHKTLHCKANSHAESFKHKPVMEKQIKSVAKNKPKKQEYICPYCNCKQKSESDLSTHKMLYCKEATNKKLLIVNSGNNGAKETVTSSLTKENNIYVDMPKIKPTSKHSKSIASMGKLSDISDNIQGNSKKKENNFPKKDETKESNIIHKKQTVDCYKEVDGVQENGIDKEHTSSSSPAKVKDYNDLSKKCDKPKTTNMDTDNKERSLENKNLDKNVEIVSCSYCKIGFEKIDDFEIHHCKGVRTDKTNKRSSSTETNNHEDTIKCEKCNSSFQFEVDLTWHRFKVCGKNISEYVEVSEQRNENEPEKEKKTLEKIKECQSVSTKSKENISTPKSQISMEREDSFARNTEKGENGEKKQQIIFDLRDTMKSKSDLKDKIKSKNVRKSDKEHKFNAFNQIGEEIVDKKIPLDLRSSQSKTRIPKNKCTKDTSSYRFSESSSTQTNSLNGGDTKEIKTARCNTKKKIRILESMSKSEKSRKYKHYSSPKEIIKTDLISKRKRHLPRSSETSNNNTSSYKRKKILNREIPLHNIVDKPHVPKNIVDQNCYSASQSSFSPTSTKILDKVTPYISGKRKHSIYCEKCGKSMRNAEEIDNPRCGHKKTLFWCPVCKASFLDINTLMLHQAKKHQADEVILKEIEKADQNIMTKYYCCSCGTYFKFIKHLIYHKISNHKFFHHLSEKHCKEPIIRAADPKLKCYECVFCHKKIFNSLELLLQHESTSKRHKRNVGKYEHLKPDYSPLVQHKFEHICYICNLGFVSFKDQQIHMLECPRHYALEKKARRQETHIMKRKEGSPVNHAPNKKSNSIEECDFHSYKPFSSEVREDIEYNKEIYTSLQLSTNSSCNQTVYNDSTTTSKLSPIPYQNPSSLSPSVGEVAYAITSKSRTIHESPTILEDPSDLDKSLMWHHEIQKDALLSTDEYERSEREKAQQDQNESPRTISDGEVEDDKTYRCFACRQNFASSLQLDKHSCPGPF